MLWQCKVAVCWLEITEVHWNAEELEGVLVETHIPGLEYPLEHPMKTLEGI